MAISVKVTSALEITAVSAQFRAAQYRVKAAQLQRMAEEESLGRLRHDLLRLADEYEALAWTTELRRPPSDEREPFRGSGS